MKTLTYCFTALALLLVTACTRYNCCDPKVPNFIFAQKNNVQWSATPAGTIGTADTIKILGTGINNGSNLHDTIGFKFKYAGSGIYKVSPDMVFYHTRVGNTPPLLYYKLDTAFNNSFTISYNDQPGHTIAGYFQLKFNSPADTTTVTFLNGNFKSPLN